MTQEEQERDLQDAQTYLSITPLVVDRCRHKSVTMTSLWVFQTRPGKTKRHKPVREQIASMTRCDDQNDCWKWRVNMVQGGQPTTQRYFPTMLAAIGEIVRNWKPEKPA